MPIIFTKAKEQIIIYWLLGFYFLLFSASALASCALASLIGANWSTLDKQGRYMIALAIFVNWSTIMLAFFNKAATKIQSGDLPIAPDDSQLISRKTVETKSVKTESINP